MASKKRKPDETQPLIKEFLKKNMSPAKVKIEKAEVETSSIGHLHQFIVQFGSDREKLTVDCEQPCTVLGALKSHLPRQFKEKIKTSEENLVIRVGEGNDSHIIPTHFPCSCVKEGECLTITTSSNIIEKKKSPYEEQVLPREEYSVFFIDKVGGKNSKTKTDEIFRCTNIMEPFRYYCVYGRKGMTVVNALAQDGRFVDSLRDFTLSDNETGDLTNCSGKVDKRHGKKFQICLPKKGKGKETVAQQPTIRDPVLTQQSSQEQLGQDERPSRSNKPQSKIETARVLQFAAEKGISLKAAMEQTGSIDNFKEIYERLRQQFPQLKELMKSRFPGRSFKKGLKLKQENFGKIQQSFSEVYRLEKLLENGKSVCTIIVYGVCQGTGFVLFDEFIMTNAHLFEKCVKENKLLNHINVFALFNYDKPEPETDYFRFSAEKTFVDIDFDLDYAVLRLKPEGQNSNPRTQAENVRVPPGLLKKFTQLPESGEACIIGHPAGGVKRIDPTCIIEPENRLQAVIDHLAPYNGTLFLIHSITELLKCQGIENIMVGGTKADKVGAYNTFMYHGSSGSPVFDADCRVFGLHTAGFTYGFPRHENSVIEFARTLLHIFKKFVDNLKSQDGMEEVLNRIQEEAQENEELMEILTPKQENQRHDVEDQEMREETG